MINFDEMWSIVTKIKFDVCSVGWWENMTSYDIDHLRKEATIQEEINLRAEYCKGKGLFSWKDKERYLVDTMKQRIL